MLLSFAPPKESNQRKRGRKRQPHQFVAICARPFSAPTKLVWFAPFPVCHRSSLYYKKVKQKLNYARKNWPNNLNKYEHQEKQMSNRNSYSKTDPDVTFMRMKEDHLCNGQLKPSYNLQLSTGKQFILGYTLHQSPADTVTLKDHMESFQKQYGTMPEVLVADAGYGSEENYEFLEKNDIEAYVKYNYFHTEQSKGWKKDPYKTDNLIYNETEDYYTCPQGKKLTLRGESKKVNGNGYEQTYRIYQAEGCHRCPVRNLCYKSKGDRKIEINRKEIFNKGY